MGISVKFLSFYNKHSPNMAKSKTIAALFLIMLTKILNTKTGMIFSANFDRRKTNPFVYIKFWKQVCLPSLLFGIELFSFNKTLLENLNDVNVGF